MSLKQLLSNSQYYFNNLPTGKAIKATSAELACGGYERVYNGPPRKSTNIYEKDWDMLVVLDACRVDALRAVADEYDFLSGDISSVVSTGSKTVDWMEHTFVKKHQEKMKKTLYVTFNPNSEEVLQETDFLQLYEVWRSAWEADRGGVPARSITDYAVAASRRHASEYDRFIVHYKNPHQPYPELDDFDARNTLSGSANDRSGVFGALIEGRLSREEVWNGYLNHLRSGLDEIERLLGSVDADRVVITSDHGECFGEWGLYGHPTSVPVPTLVRVPWVETTATEHDSSQPQIDPTDALRRRTEGESNSVNSKLSALGYK